MKYSAYGRSSALNKLRSAAGDILGVKDSHFKANQARKNVEELQKMLGVHGAPHDKQINLFPPIFFANYDDSQLANVFSNWEVLAKVTIPRFLYMFLMPPKRLLSSSTWLSGAI